MIWAQQLLSPSETVIIFAIEPVAAALFAIQYGGEIIGFLGWIGGALVCIGVIYGELE